MTDAMYYAAAFHLPTLEAQSGGNLGNLVIKRSGNADLTVDLGGLSRADATGAQSQYFFHLPFNFVFEFLRPDPSRGTAYPRYALRSLGSVLALALDAAAVSAGWAAGYSFTAANRTGFFESLSGVPTAKYRIAAGVSIQYQFTSIAGAWLFGASGISLSSAATTHDLPYTPRFLVKPSRQRCSTPDEEFSGADYEPDEISTYAMADDGTGYGNARLAAPLYRNWVHQFETKAKTYRLLASATDDSWTFQDLFEHCRTVYPFVVAHGGFASHIDYELFVLRESSFKPRVASTANHAAWHIPFRCINAGAIDSLS